MMHTFEEFSIWKRANLWNEFVPLAISYFNITLPFIVFPF